MGFHFFLWLYKIAQEGRTGIVIKSTKLNFLNFPPSCIFSLKFDNLEPFKNSQFFWEIANISVICQNRQNRGYLYVITGKSEGKEN